MDVWLGWIATFLDVDEGSKVETEIPIAGGHFLLTGSSCKAETGDNDMQYRPSKSTGYIMIANGLEVGKIYVCLRLSLLFPLRIKIENRSRESSSDGGVHFTAFFCVC